MQLQKEENLELRQDISVMIDDIHSRGYEAVKESIFDHQAGKVMTDRWGNRVRVEEYIFKQPTEDTVDTVQILALNLRTAGPNAGISSLDFRVRFDDDISDTVLTSLPWDDYMSNPLESDVFGGEGHDQLIVYESDNPGYYDPRLPQPPDYPDGFPIPETFSLEVKNPYGDSVEATESYSEILSREIGDDTVWYQEEEGGSIEINGTQYYYEGESGMELNSRHWGSGWNQANRFTFLDYYIDEDENDAWLMGLFYLIENDGDLVDFDGDDDGDDLSEVHGIRDLINPDHNLEMVFFSSEFEGTPEDLPDIIAAYEGEIDDQYEIDLYNAYRTIDVITIPEITEPYYMPEAEQAVLLIE